MTWNPNSPTTTVSIEITSFKFFILSPLFDDSKFCRQAKRDFYCPNIVDRAIIHNKKVPISYMRTIILSSLFKDKEGLGTD